MNTSHSFEKILIANRGEIACRIIRTAHRMGYGTVAVYSDADAQAPHVRLADEAAHIGASPARASYLDMAKIIAAARQTGAGAIHPGYGFLSENPAFADACAQAGLTFIGPSSASMLAMGDKARAKARMRNAGVPCAPGYLTDNPTEQTDERLIAEATHLGYPLLVKAVAGGGGRGMRLVHRADELPAALQSARREALSAFGSDVLMLERLIERGRHIEIQVFADSHGNAVHLGERDCTAQRRRQKVIEESPSPIVTPAMRQAMGRDAVAAALAVGYQGAGTVEFIVDQALNHYFLEMNTRLQVEHPVTECVTGFDLVEWQIRVARGEALPAQQEDIRLAGHAIEVRLYAEDPYQAFAPQTGDVLLWQPDAARQDGTRVDGGLLEGVEMGAAVSPYYDPMVAKLITHGATRDDAIRQMRRALAQSPLLGLRNNGGFLRDLLDTPAFRAGAMHTALLDEWLEQGHALYVEPTPDDDAWALAAALLALRGHAREGGSLHAGWRPNSVRGFDLHLRCGAAARSLRATPAALGDARSRVQVVQGDSSEQIELNAADGAHGQLSFLQHGARRKAVHAWRGGELHLALQGRVFVFSEASPYPDAGSATDPRRACSPVAGKITQVLAQLDDSVAEGQNLVCIEAMKMEMWVPAAMAGRVQAVHAKAGDQVELGALLVELEGA